MKQRPTCLRCGQPLPEGSSRSRRFCPECGRLRNIEMTQARQQAAARKREEKREFDQAFADRAYCKPCDYYGSEDYGKNLCDYILKTGHRRGCKAGVGCTQREIRNENNARSKRNNAY